MIDLSGRSELEFNQAHRVSTCESKTKTKNPTISQLQIKIRSLLDIG